MEKPTKKVPLLPNLLDEIGLKILPRPKSIPDVIPKNPDTMNHAPIIPIKTIRQSDNLSIFALPG